MLVSYKYKFIFLKTIKTGSSSVFTFFTPYCLPKGFKFNYETLDPKWNGFYNTGIVGDIEPKHQTNKYHVTVKRAKEICDKKNAEIWKNSFKFCVIRNPWDLVVSKYCWKKKSKKNKDMDFNYFVSILDDGKNKMRTRQDLYKIDGKKDKYVCDFHIKYERLEKGIEEACKVCGIKNYNLKNLAEIHSNARDKSKHYSEYYNDKTKNIVAKLYSDDIRRFHYEFEKF